jgi:tRNA(Ile)-lysidine synthase
MPFSPASLHVQLMQLPVPRRYCVAFSGGVDSHVLLHALVQLRDSLACSLFHAIHINHGIHPDAEQWERHCAMVCEGLGVSFEVRRVQVQRQVKHSLEATAREARYTALAELIHPRDMLLLAHHQDDQAETLLLQLLRGSGAKGLASMPGCVAFAQGWLARPLLVHSRDELQAYARVHQLPWIEDPSNLDTAFDRNFLRHVILPELRQRWPSVSMTLSRVAQHQADAAALLEDLAQQDLANLVSTNSQILPIAPLTRLAPMRQRNVLRYWLHRRCALPLPGTVQLQRILDEVLLADEDAMPIVHWPGAEVRRYRNALYAMKPLQQFDSHWQQQWDLRNSLMLPTGETLEVRKGEGIGLRMNELTQGVSVRYRRGGERCRLPGREHHHELKKLLQDWSVPPWQRDRIPLLYIGNELAQVAEFCVCESFAAKPDETGLQIVLKPQAAAIETVLENKDNRPGCTP